MRTVKLLHACAALALLAGCGPEINHRQAVYVLVDTSGTYAKEVTKAQSVVNYLLGSLQPGDSLAVGRVKSRSNSGQQILTLGACEPQKCLDVKMLHGADYRHRPRNRIPIK